MHSTAQAVGMIYKKDDQPLKGTTEKGCVSEHLFSDAVKSAILTASRRWKKLQ